MLQKIINKFIKGQSFKGRTVLDPVVPKNFLGSLVNFIKYHNAVSIAISLVLALSFSAMAASDDIKDAILGEKIVTERGIDNSALLAADLANFDLAMKIIAVSQDPEPSPLANGENAAGDQNYYIAYAFKTLGIEDNRWQEIAREKILTVSKAALGSEDLGIYATEEISEVADNELAYLKEVQAAQRAKGETKVVQTTDYSGLIGLVLDVKNKILPGYEPVIKPPKPAENTNEQIPAAAPESTATPTPILPPTPTPQESESPSPMPTPAAPTPEPTLSPTPELLPEPTPEPTPEPMPTPDLTSSPQATATPTPEPAPAPEPTPTSAPSEVEETPTP